MEHPSAKYCINVKNVSFGYNEITLLEDISFFLMKGEFLSLIGKSGSGKTTLFRLLASLEKPSRGDIVVDGAISYMTQYPLLLPRRTVLENLMLLKELNPRAYKSRSEHREAACFYLNEVGLYNYQNNLPKELSGGMQSRIVLARILLEDKPILLLDEPFAFLDAITRAEMQQLILSLQEKFHKSVLLITHDILEAVSLSHRLCLLSNGVISKSWDIPNERSFHGQVALEALQALG